jgi:hypothetical protein
VGWAARVSRTEGVFKLGVLEFEELLYSEIQFKKVIETLLEWLVRLKRLCGLQQRCSVWTDGC